MLIQERNVCLNCDLLCCTASHVFCRIQIPEHVCVAMLFLDVFLILLVIEIGLNKIIQ